MITELWSFVTTIPMLPLSNVAVTVLVLGGLAFARHIYKESQGQDILPEPEAIASGEIVPNEPEDIVQNLQQYAQILVDLKRQIPAEVANKINAIGYPSSCGAMANEIGCKKQNLKSNKFQVGIGENAFKVLSAAEAKTILAHEVSHATLGHLTNTNTLARQAYNTNIWVMGGSGSAICIMGIASLFDSQRQLPEVVTLFLLSAVFAKVLSMHFQKQEFQADRESMRWNDNPRALISGLEKLHDLGLAWKKQRAEKTGDKNSKQLSEFFPTHPTLLARQKALGIHNDSPCAADMPALSTPGM